MTVDAAIQRIIAEFPFEGYMTSGKIVKGVYSNTAHVVLRYLKPGNTILDFGCGPCDKTVVLQFLGFRCSGYDDLLDDWHQISENKEKIVTFANKCGIDFRQVGKGVSSFKKRSFDMLMLHDVLEHLHDSPCNLLNDLLELIKPNGLLFITVPNAVNIRKE